MSIEVDDIEEQISHEEQERSSEAQHEQLLHAMAEWNDARDNYAMCYALILANKPKMIRAFMANLNIDANEAEILMGFD